MCNCNQKRSQYSQSEGQDTKGMVKVKLTDKSSLVLTGDITGRTYIFRKLNDIAFIDKRDAMNLKEYAGLQFV